MEYSALSQIASKLLFGLFIYYIIQNDLGLEYIFMAYICSELIRTIISFIFSFHFTKYTFNISKNTIQYLVKQSLPFVFGYGLLMLYNRFDILLLSIIQGDIAVGFYSAAYRITESILFIPGALASTLMPIMAKQFVENKNKLVKTYIIGTRFIFMILFPITVGSVILSRDIITWIYTEKFLSSTIVFQILSLTIMFNSLISLQNSIFIAINKQRLNNIAILLCAVLNIALNIILIPKMSFTGAGLATLISVICLYLIGFHFVYKETGIQPFKKDILKYVFASLIMGISISIMEHDIVFKMIDGFLIYIAIIILLKGLNKEDIKMLRK
jgi:O-antigen/teichoic acid export membrane protein